MPPEIAMPAPEPVAAVTETLPKPKPIKPTPQPFVQLLNDLNTMDVPQTAGVQDYQNASKVLDQFEQHIAKQNKPRAEVHFSDTHLSAREQALLKLKNAADAGHTGAQLRLGMYELLGEGLDNNKEAGINLVKQAAEKGDVRAERLLSHLYYQGIGVAMNSGQGKYWLEKAAANGHVEASELVNEWQHAEALMMTRQQEQSSIQRYQILLGIVAVAALLLIVLL